MIKFIRKIYVRLISIHRCDRRHYEGQRHHREHCETAVAWL